MSMGMGISLRVSQALSLRQDMECALSQILCVTQRLRLSLELYLNREDELTRLYKKALQRGMVKFYDKHGMKFEYALVHQM